jgi:hypothetical protein
VEVVGQILFIGGREKLDRLNILYDRFIDVYGDDVEGVKDLLGEILFFYEDASDDEILEYIINCVEENGEEIEDIDQLVSLFSDIKS